MFDTRILCRYYFHINIYNNYKINNNFYILKWFKIFPFTEVSERRLDTANKA